MAKGVALAVAAASLLAWLAAGPGVGVRASAGAGAGEDWNNCPPCKCGWVGGRKNADCRHSKDVVFSSIPKHLSTEVRNIDLTRQQLFELPKRAFAAVGLGDLQKVKLVQCSLMAVHKHAFAGMQLLIELDMSHNDIDALDVDTFRDNVRLRILLLNHNKIARLEDGLFFNMTFLQRIELNNNRILTVGRRVFVKPVALQYLMLDDNQLSHLELAVIEPMAKLNSLSLHNNPWRCDCHLKAFRDEAVRRNLFTSPTECAEPERLKGQGWLDLASEDFACRPRILEPAHAGASVRADSENVTLPCKVSGDPKPDVNWVFRHSIIETNPRRPGSQRYVISAGPAAGAGDAGPALSAGDALYWVNLTVVGINFHDGGVYRCTAKNPGGMQERNVTLVLSGNYGPGTGVLGPVANLADPLALILSVVLVIVVLALIVTLVLWYCVCRRRSPRHHKGDSLSPNGDICMEGTASEMEKSLITEVNPVVKPPRQYSVPPSVASGVTEVSEVNRTLLDNDSVFAGGDDESRSFDFVEPTPRKSNHYSDVEHFLSERPYPPDLLSFPARGSQVSPAASLASTVPDHSRLPAQHGPQSPLHSPLYDAPGIYRTLPYSRSHSPFTPPHSGPVITPRSGYITIPRRPRVPSWSSAPPGTPLVAEPVYDNLGLRTTAEGSSILSLNKAGETTPRPRPLVAPLPAGAAAAAAVAAAVAAKEQQDAARQLPALPAMPTQRSLQNLNLSPERKRESWARATPDGCSQKSSVEADARRLSSASVASTLDGSAKKMPPKPPPKPKKPVTAGPLFEDEGEDGTEV